MVGGGIREFVDGPAFLEKELFGLGVDRYLYVRVHDHASGPVPICVFQEHLTCFFDVKCITFLTLGLVH